MLEARGITYAYPGARTPLYRDFDLAVGPDERVALSAPSGFGKTTLCRMLAGYDRPQKGEILVDRRPAAEARHVSRAADPAASRNRRRPAHAHESNAGRSRRGASALAGRPGHPETVARAFPHELSGGELQRFCIARALAANPRYLVADEVSTMLDAVTQAQIWRFLVEETQARGIGLVFVSHSHALTERIATRVVDLAMR